ncbi:neuroligin-2 [Bacillus rossius redtenbacheri]|uniref:neuroligin-2 n=1 Tax=Bacillus rossius redtenbacheri TaxID=93214 RepID=UPI002FDCB228
MGYEYLLCLLLMCSSFNFGVCQRDNYPRIPRPGEPDYATVFYNGRRYGQTQLQGNNFNRDDYGYGENRGDRVQQWNQDITPPGVLGRWRSDLQGKQRPESLTLKRDVTVTTSSGQVQGFKVYLYDNPDPKVGFRPGQTPVERIQGEVCVFLGIPYATPPVLEGRFKPPRVHRGWQLLQAVDFGPACPQHVRYTGATKGIRDMDEDCLYLNIYSPSVSANVAEKYPVMIYIHGGDFVRGASNTFPGHVMATFYNVVVVTFNYRLGALGFLSTGDENSPGNYGMLDQSLAVKWVYDNIDVFNGDRTSLTLFGPGAGAASAGLLMVAPRTRNLISKVIAQSGSALADWALITDRYQVQNNSRVYGQLLGCSIESSWKLVNCLKQGRSWLELGNAEFQPQVGVLSWGPVLDGNFRVPGDTWYEGWREADWHFLHEKPERLIRTSQFNSRLAYMSGVTTQEAAYLVYNNESLASNGYTVSNKFIDEKVRELVVRYNYTLNSNGIYNAIRYMYTYWPNPNSTDFARDYYINMMTDYLYHAPNDKIAKLLLERNLDVYLYVMNTTVEAFRYPQWRRVSHDIEFYFLSGAPFMDIEFFPRKPHLERTMWKDNDRNMSHFFMKAFTDFARYGNPSHQEILGLHFDLARNGELRYLNINTTYNSSVQLNYRQTEAAFWSMYLPTVIGHLVPTYPPITEYWWEPKEPLQIAFWSISALCLLLLVAVVIFCILWRNAQRKSTGYCNGDIMIVRDDVFGEHGIDNHSNSNVFEYRDIPPRSSAKKSSTLETKRSGSAPSVRTGSAISLKENMNATSGNPMPTPVIAAKRNKTLVDSSGVPQTEV